MQVGALLSVVKVREYAIFNGARPWVVCRLARCLLGDRTGDETDDTTGDETGDEWGWGVGGGCAGTACLWGTA